MSGLKQKISAKLHRNRSRENLGLASDNHAANNNLYAAAPLGTPLPLSHTETIVKPTIVQETIRTDRLVEIQPVVHREVEVG